MFQEYPIKRWFNTIFLDPAFHFLILVSFSLKMSGIKDTHYSLEEKSSRIDHGKWDLLVLHACSGESHKLLSIVLIDNLIQNGHHFTIALFVCKLALVAPFLNLKLKRRV